MKVRNEEIRPAPPDRYSATLADNVWVGMGSLIMRTTLDPHTFVPAGSVIRSRSDAWGMRLVSAKEKRYMEEVLEATNRLRKEYRKTRSDPKQMAV